MRRRAAAEDEWEEVGPARAQPFLGSRRDLAAHEQLEVDGRAYRMLCRATPEWPCLSFDFLPLPGQAAGPPRYPLDVGVVAASQAEPPGANALYALRFAEVGVTQFEEDEAPPEDSFEESEPLLLGLRVPLAAATNRVRVLPAPAVAALMSETGQLLLADLRALLPALQALPRDASELVAAAAPTQAFELGAEGFALGWSPLRAGELAAGTLLGGLHLFCAGEGGAWAPLRQWRAHGGAVEDLAFSPTDPFALASCSADQRLTVHDLRSAAPALTLRAHDCDVNALSWNARAPALLATGGEDGGVRVWDLRHPARAALSHLGLHAEAVVSLGWAPHDEWSLAVGAADDRVSLWDLSVEPDAAAPAPDGVPDQLLFLHQGVEELREVGWHPLLHNVLFCTAASGFHLFEPALDDALSADSGDSADA